MRTLASRMIFDILTIFPNLLESPLKEGIIRRAVESGHTDINIVNIRDFADGPHSVTDDRPFGGGEGMVMKAEPLARAVKNRTNEMSSSKVILLSPQGRKYNQKMAEELATESHLVLVCGRYEGVDERFTAGYVDDEISIGDYILTGGELAAMILVDSVTRLLPGVLGCSDSAEKDSFSRPMLKHPQYTRPREFEKKSVPEELLSGDHGKIESYRFCQAIRRTIARRPGLIQQLQFSKAELKLLRKNNLYDQVKKLQVDSSHDDISG